MGEVMPGQATQLDKENMKRLKEMFTGPECKHEFSGWREFPDVNGGEQVCKLCGMGALAHSLRHGP
jgi:transcription elongation factor Elf1